MYQIITEAIRMRERDKLIILDIHEKFRKYRKSQQKKFHSLLKNIREESGNLNIFVLVKINNNLYIL